MTSSLPPDSLSSLLELARQVFVMLRGRKRRLVLAESCTGGLLASTLAEIPGVSEWFCGSAVTYRNETKSGWLEVSRDVLAEPQFGAVSPLVAEQMCAGVLARTPEADLAASITGHLGPHAPAHLDGVVYIGVRSRDSSSPSIQRRTLTNETPPGHSLREVSRVEAACDVFQAILKELSHPSQPV